MAYGDAVAAVLVRQREELLWELHKMKFRRELLLCELAETDRAIVARYAGGCQPTSSLAWQHERQGDGAERRAGGGRRCGELAVVVLVGLRLRAARPRGGGLPGTGHGYGGVFGLGILRNRWVLCSSLCD
ncbi:hypothetical protein ABZP36_028046 [Zizania latifolia]